jgi:hydrogenase expression/formation protein HypD
MGKRAEMDLRGYRQPDLVRNVLRELRDFKRQVRFMEVCGSHTMAIGHWGLRKLLPDNIRLISGPGCPVCVTPSTVIDELVKLKGVVIATFGDLIRVPGTEVTLEQARAAGCDVRTVYSPLEALELSQEKETLFVGIGFETTIPGVAYTIQEARRRNLGGFSVLSLFKLIPPALDALLSGDGLNLDGFILPGHVSAVTGTEAYRFLPEKYGIGGVVAGFEPLDIVLAIARLTRQLSAPRIENEYSRIVTARGNRIARTMISEVFRVGSSVWRGLGEIHDSGLELRAEYERYDAARRYGIEVSSAEPETACKCGSVLRGELLPTDCPLFATACTPGNPVGSCMVSSEGSCAAYYTYER